MTPDDELNEENVSDAEFNTPRKYPRKVKIALAVLCGLLAAVLLPCYLIFSGKPKFKRAELESADWLRQANLVNRIMNQTMRSRPGDVETVHLSPDEIRSLLRFVDNSENLMKLAGVPPRYAANFKDHPFQLRYRENQFDLAAGLDSGCRLLFGGYAVLKMRFVPKCANGQWDIAVEQASAGWLPVLPMTGRAIALHAWERTRRSDWGKIFDGIVVEMKVRASGALAVRYRADKLKILLSSVRF